ncbi:MAG: Beta-lactamase related protein [Candidatus Carbobacillus altaicus]|uniref:Beta-lactamase related protein n=1 Tax=Candidatus Carbonibacillus altaicus TaxID=2163959 RepID=A0A2R6Y222_9BACL|nr:MAG: Beta-lactamase related protein [Candidatus Carbobacillus altaicus]
MTSENPPRTYALGKDVFMIDVHDLHMPYRTGVYVLPQAGVLIDVGPSSGIQYLLEGLRQLHITPSSIQGIVLTHIHLDHAGGVGLLLTSMPQAKVIVHPRGARHLAHPEKLIAGAKAVYGEMFESYFHPVLPVPEDRIITPGDGETLSFAGGKSFTFIDTPGHARHHLSIMDQETGDVFTGDTVGILYNQVLKASIAHDAIHDAHIQNARFEKPFVLPSTSPNQFDAKAMRGSWERIRSFNPKRLFFGHFGSTEDVEEAFLSAEKGLQLYEETLKDFLSPFLSNHSAQHALSLTPEHIERLATLLNERIKETLLTAFLDDIRSADRSDDLLFFHMLALDQSINAFGLLDAALKQMGEAL